MRYKYWHIASYLIVTNFLHGIYVALEGNICLWCIFGSNVWRTCCMLFFNLYVIWCIYVDDSSSAVGHICTMSQAYLFIDICQWCEIYVCSWSYYWLHWVHMRYLNWHSCLMWTWRSAHVAYLWHLRGILVFGMYMAMTCFLSLDANGASNDSIAFLLLRWLLRSIIWLLVSVLVLVLTSVSCAIDNSIDITWYWSKCQQCLINEKVMLHLILIILN